MKLLLSSAFLLLSAGLFAQTNFAGTWALNESKSNFGQSQFRMAAASMTVTQDAKVLTIESTMSSPDGQEMKTSAKYNLDGTVSENPMFNSSRKTTATWSDDKASLKLAHTMTFDMGGESRTVNSSDTWKLSEGGKVLLIESVRTGRDGAEMKTTAAYDKK